MLVRTESKTETPVPSSMDMIFDRYVERIHSYFYRRLGNREDAEDLTSEVFLHAAQELDVHRSDASVTGWLYTVARNVLMDHWRRYYRYGSLLPIDDLRLSAPVAQIYADGATDASEHEVAEILAALPPRYRTVLELRFLRGLTIRETAQEMGITPDNVKVTQHRALARALTRGDAASAEGPHASSQATPRGPLHAVEVRR